jgi:dihydrofolate reductase
MRTLISTAFISLDGVVEAPGGEAGYRNAGWTFKDVEFLPDAYELKGAEQKEAAAMLMGRKSYEAFSPVWPGMAEFGDYKTMPKYVVSSTLTEDRLVSDWGETTILRSLDEVAALKQTDGGPIIVHGSIALNQGLQEADLIDRYHLLVFPVLLGAGRRLFSTADMDTRKLKLVDSAAYANGVQKNVFEVVH